MLKTESNELLNKENTKETLPAACREFMYEKAYRNCRPVPDLYCIHSESKLEEIHNVVPQATTFFQNPVKYNWKKKMQKGVSAMRELYSLEHKILPGFIFPDEEGRSINLFMLGNRFSEVCLDYIRYARGIKDKNADTGYSAESFVAEPVVIKDNGKPVYYITRFRFPFIEDISFSTLCPRAYLVHGLQGEDPRYYTIEYDQTGFREAGSYWLCGWRPSRSGSLVHANMGTIDPDEEGEIRKLMDMNNENYGVE